MIPAMIPAMSDTLDDAWNNKQL